MRDFFDKRPIYRVHSAQTLRSVALSVVSIYVPIYLLTLGYTLSEVIFFYAILHSFGLLVTFAVVTRLINRFGTLFTIKWYYPFQILFLALLFFLEKEGIPLWLIAVVGGTANVLYYVPLNMILLRNTNVNKLGSDLATFFALPKMFGIIGPIISALLIPIIGFWWVFTVAIIGLFFSYLPLAGLYEKPRGEVIAWSRIWNLLKKRKSVFMLEGLDNILEETEWFWGIYVFLLIGSLSAPGIVGALASLGGVAFTFFVGAKVNKNTSRYILLGSLALMGVAIGRMFVDTPVWAYVLTIGASFAFMIFLVSYTSMIYKRVKKDDEEEFIILREIPTVLGRLVVFGLILLMVRNLKFLFLFPILVLALLLWKNRYYRDKQLA